MCSSALCWSVSLSEWVLPLWQTYASLEDFHSAKQSYKAACKLLSRQGMDREETTRSLRKGVLWGGSASACPLN